MVVRANPVPFQNSAEVKAQPKGTPLWDPELPETGEISEALKRTTDHVTPKLSAT